MKLISDCLDSLIHAIQLVAQSVAFLLGIHLVVLLHFIHFLSTDPIGALRLHSNRRRGSSATTITTTTTTSTRRPRVSSNYQSYISHSRSTYRSHYPRLLHLPSLEPRPHEDLIEAKSISFVDYLKDWIDVLGYKMREEIVDLADQIESRGGKTGDLITQFRKRGEEEVNPILLQRLPPELINHILSLAASDSIPTKICLLSKTHHRMITPRLFSSIELSNPRIFRQLRMTLALHNPSLGKHIQSLSVASSTFDSYGYFPIGIAESAALGVGLEQILLTAPNLKHLYLDLFSLAAAHDGTVSRLQRGPFPLSLATEFAAPQYLSLPIFSRLQHLDLAVFGLEKMAVDHLRQTQPQVKTLTLRWVTRQNRAFGDVEYDPSSGQIAREAMGGGDSDDNEDDRIDDFDLDMSDRERESWSRGGHRYNDFLLFVEAVDLLRRWPESSEGDEGQRREGEPLDAITILAWPKAMRELSHYYRQDKDVQVLDSVNLDDPAWDRSLGHQSEFSSNFKPLFDRPSRRLMRGAIASVPHSKQQIPKPSQTLTPLRLAIDPTYQLGPRRGPLESWSSQIGRTW